MSLTAPIFTDKDVAREYFERQRWADGVYRPHCGGTEKYREPSGKPHRAGLHQACDRRKQYTVAVGTMFERSKAPLNQWLLGPFRMPASRKGMSVHQLHRTMGVTCKTAWFMWHRIRETMCSGELSPVGGAGGTVESDETFIGSERTCTGPRNACRHKMKVLSLIDRESGQARAFVVDK